MKKFMCFCVALMVCMGLVGCGSKIASSVDEIEKLIKNEEITEYLSSGYYGISIIDDDDFEYRFTIDSNFNFTFRDEDLNAIEYDTENNEFETTNDDIQKIIQDFGIKDGESLYKYMKKHYQKEVLDLDIKERLEKFDYTYRITDNPSNIDEYALVIENGDERILIYIGKENKIVSSIAYSTDKYSGFYVIKSNDDPYYNYYLVNNIIDGDSKTCVYSLDNYNDIFDTCSSDNELDAMTISTHGKVYNDFLGLSTYDYAKLIETK